jgi:N-methylhydantoinase B
MLKRIDDNIGYVEEGGERKVVCNHCSHVLSDNGRDYLGKLARYEGPVSMAGPQVAPDSSVYVDARVVFRQYCCPSCFTAFHTEVVPVEDGTGEKP